MNIYGLILNNSIPESSEAESISWSLRRNRRLFTAPEIILRQEFLIKYLSPAQGHLVPESRRPFVTNSHSKQFYLGDLWLRVFISDLGLQQVWGRWYRNNRLIISLNQGNMIRYFEIEWQLFFATFSHESNIFCYIWKPLNHWLLISHAKNFILNPFRMLHALLISPKNCAI